MDELAEQGLTGAESIIGSGAAATRTHDGARPAGVIRTPLPEDALRATFARRLHYWWSLSVAAALLLTVGPPVLLVSWLARHQLWVYPYALWGARTWLRLSGMRVVVSGRENLDPSATYIFAANHRSYLDTATLFAHTGRRIGLLAKKELLQVPVMGVGMGFVNIMAIDRSNRQRAIETVRAATDRIRRGVTFGVFVEGTRARPGELLPFKKGAFHMAIEAGVPVVPVAIRHTDVLMGKGTGAARPGTIEMVMLPAIPVEGLSTAREEDVTRLIEETRSRIAAALGAPPDLATGARSVAS